MAPERTRAQDVLRLAGLLACVALATSRFGLIAHELVGHGGVAVAAGAHVSEVQLFWFAGGWIRYQLSAPTVTAELAIAMGGIFVELVVGLGLWFGIRGAGLGRRIIRGIAAALVVHGSWYLATGAWHGYGDGVVLYRVLGDARIFVAVAAGLVTCTAAFAGAREVLGALAATLPSRRIAWMIVAMVAAGGLHLALAVTELRIRHDQAYVTIMQPERERLVARDLDRYTAEAQRRGIAISERDLLAEQARLEREHRTFPFAWLLGVAAACAAIAGWRRARTSDVHAISHRMLAIAAGAAGIAIGAVIAIDLVVR